MRLGIVQVNPTVGDLEGNVDRCLDGIKQASVGGAQLIVLPEMAIPGCHPKDILFDSKFITALGEATADLVDLAKGLPPVIVGTIVPQDGHPSLYNAALLLEDGESKLLATKLHPPNDDVFYESRWFTPGPPPVVHQIAGKQVGVMVGGELEPANFPAETDLIINLAASPYYRGVLEKRWAYVRNFASVDSNQGPVVFANLIGGNDELIFDGRSFVACAGGETAVQLEAFKECVKVIDLADLTIGALPIQLEENTRLVKEALVLGLRDFAHKNGIRQAFLGLSGGVDSSVVAVLAAEALTPAQVTGVAMPSRHTDTRSTQAAEILAKTLGIHFKVSTIKPLHTAAEIAYPDLFSEGVGAENVQARLRMLILMGYVNKYGGMLLNTGNKTEATLGYSTLYGDTAGTLCPIADLTKPEVYQLARWINKESEVIPGFVLERDPTAELKPGQVDPFNYDEISPILEQMVRQNRANPAMRAAEHKRTQMGVVLKVSEKAFGSGRMIPITGK
jgi:NAD+ synthase (glutamine-hydrolysing)